MVQFIQFMDTTINLKNEDTFFRALTKEAGSITEKAIMNTSQLG